MKRKEWKLRETNLEYPLDKRILLSRGISEEKWNEFLNPELSHLLSPFLFEQMEKAVIRIISAIKNQEKIGIFGDYDADGLSACALLQRNIRALGGRTVAYIPHRTKEGYGLSIDGLKKLKEKEAEVVITVDCGVSAFKSASFAKEIKLDLIITDHHEIKKEKPSAFALLNPKDSKYPFKGLAGVGVAFKLIEAIYEKLGIPKKPLYWDLDLVTIGTVADQVPLLYENRVFVSKGLEVLTETKKASFKALKKVSGLRKREVNTRDVGFILAPRLNASGRVKHAKRALELLITTDSRTALDISREMDENNRIRQSVEEEIFIEVLKKIEKLDLEKEWVIVLGGKWHEGVIGIVASKIVERFSRPVFLFSIQNELAKGSARSILGFHITQALEKVENLVEEYGGHYMAAGLKLQTRKIEEFRERINEVAHKMLSPEDLLPSIYIDCETTIEEIKQASENLKQLEPFGEGNPEPVLLLKNVKILSLPRNVGKKSLRFYIGNKDAFFSAFVPDAKNHRIPEPDTLVNAVVQWRKTPFSEKDGELVVEDMDRA